MTFTTRRHTLAALHAIATLLLTIGFFGALLIIADAVGSVWFGY